MIDLVDKRLHPRYPITLELQYKAMKRDRVQHLGDGMTLDISSGGVLFHVNDVFETKDILPDGGMIELAIKWPLLLDEVCPLKLVVRGCIVRRDDRRLAVKTEQHEFRTAGRLAKILVGPLSAHRRIPQAPPFWLAPGDYTTALSNRGRRVGSKSS